MNLAQLRAFAGVAQAGSVSEAAISLNVTQSAISHALASLERELRVQLVTRDRAGCVLTDLGTRLLPEVTELLWRANRIAEIAGAESGLNEGRLRIGLLPSSSAVLLPLIAQFKRCYPGIGVAVFEGTDYEVNEWLETRTVEVAVVTSPRPDLNAVPVAEDEMLAVVSDKHRFAGSKDLSVKEFANEIFLLSNGGCEPVIRCLFDQYEVSFDPASRITDTGTLLMMVREGLGISILPALSLEGVSEGIVSVPLRPRVPRQLLLGAMDSSLSPAACAFISYVKGNRSEFSSPRLSSFKQRGRARLPRPA